ncbi:hypothetical protein AOLI_G00115810 [Acnodon oligacanthus]
MPPQRSSARQPAHMALLDDRLQFHSAQLLRLARRGRSSFTQYNTSGERMERPSWAGIQVGRYRLRGGGGGGGGGGDAEVAVFEVLNKEKNLSASE